METTMENPNDHPAQKAETPDAQKIPKTPKWKERIVRLLKNLPLSRKLVLLFGSFLLSIFCVFIVVVMVLVSQYEKRLYDDSLRNLDYFVQSVRTEYDATEKVSYDLALSRRNQELMAELAALPYPGVEYMQQIRVLRSLLQDALYQDHYVTGACFRDTHGADYLIEGDMSALQEEKKAELLARADEASGSFVFLSPDAGCPYLIGARAVRNRLNMSMEPLGYMILLCDIHHTISDAVGKLETRPLSWLVLHEGTVIFSEGESLEEDEPGEGDAQQAAAQEPLLTTEAQLTENPITASAGRSNEYSAPLLPVKLKGAQGYEIFHQDGEQYFTTYLTSKLSGWTYVQTFRYSQLYGTIRMLRIMLFGMTLLAFVFLFTVANRLSRYITEPIELLMERMKLAESGDLKTVYEMGFEEREDEVGKLSQAFHHLLGRIQELVYENYEKQLILQDTKYKMLQAQINPHFLYNTLNTLNWMVQLGHDKDASRVVIQLGKLLRASFMRNPYASAKEELDMLRNYIAIQEYRYRDRVSFQVEETGALESFTVPRMILQPLVENALNYGADRMQGDCIIRITMDASAQYLTIGVHDNGPGVDEEKLAAMRNFTVKPEGHGIGIKNIYERLSICYDEFTFNMDSQPGCGMHITIRLPKKTKEMENTDVYTVAG